MSVMQAAKSLLLLSMLRAMDIESEAVLVRSRAEFAAVRQRCERSTLSAWPWV